MSAHDQRSDGAAATRPIRVLLVDDHLLLRKGTRAALDASPEVTVVGETGRGEEALDLARALLPDVVLLDIRRQGMGGVEVARALRQDLPEVRIVILTAYDYEQYVRALFAIGVDGYLLKSASDDELRAALRDVMGGRQVLGREIAERAVAGPAHSGIAANPTLSEREREVLALLARGERNKDIARRLEVKTATVETHISNAIAKLRVRTRTEAIVRAIEQGIIVLDE